MPVIESQEHLSQWLTKELSPMCDADPGALAKYVLALLRKPDKSDDQLKEVCISQLEVFLQSNTKRFVDKLFHALDEKLYIPREHSVPTRISVKKEEPQERVVEERKEEVKMKREIKEEVRSDEKEKVQPSVSSPSREGPSSNSGSDSRRTRAPLTGANTVAVTSKRDEPSTSRRAMSPIRAPRKRISPPPADVKIRRRSRSPPVRSRRVVGRRSPVYRKERRSRSRSPLSDKERKREREGKEDVVRSDKKKLPCSDFHGKGFCTLADNCPYDHGRDLVVVDDDALVKMVGGKVQPPPTFSLPPPGYNVIGSAANPPPPGVDTVGYNPEAPGLSVNFSVPPPPIAPVMMPAWRGPPQQLNAIAPMMTYDPSGGVPMDPSSGGGVMKGGGWTRGGRGGRGGFHPYGGRGGGAAGSGESKAPSATSPLLPANVAGRTLIVKRIPPEMNNISKLNEHFAQFGDVVNMQVHYEGANDTALITFASRFEAQKAFRSTDPILNNRFIRVLWYMTVKGGESTGTTTTTHTLSSGVVVETPLEPTPKAPIALPSVAQTKYTNAETLDAQKKAREAATLAKQEKIQKLKLTDLHRRQSAVLGSLHEQQKTVIMKMMKETDAVKKKALNKLLKQLDEKIKTSKEEVKRLSDKILARKMRQEEEGEDGNESTPSPPPAHTQQVQ